MDHTKRMKQNFIANFGSHDHHTKLMDHPDTHVQNLFHIVDQGHPEHIAKAVDHRLYMMRVTGAEKGTKAHLDKLVHDPEPAVRKQVAKRGFDEHLDKLVHDPHHTVASEVGRYDRPQDKAILLKHPSEVVRTEAVERGDKATLDAHVGDKSHHIRQAVARRGYPEHHAILMHDPDEDVRRTVAKFANREHATHLSKDADPYVQSHAEDRLQYHDRNDANNAKFKRPKPVSETTLNSFMQFTSINKDAQE